MDSKMVKQLQQMQQKMVKAQEDLANETVTATAGGGATSAGAGWGIATGAGARSTAGTGADSTVGVRAGDGVEIDHELLGECADAGHLLARGELSGGDGATDLVDDLPINRHRVACRDGEIECHGALTVLA